MVKILFHIFIVSFWDTSYKPSIQLWNGQLNLEDKNDLLVNIKCGGISFRIFLIWLTINMDYPWWKRNNCCLQV